MSANESLAIYGLPEFEAVLKDLPFAVRSDALRKAIRAAGDIVVAEIKSAANFGSYSRGEKGVKGSIKFFESQIGGNPSGVVKPDRRLRGGGRHAHLVEFPVVPHESRYYGRRAQHPGTRGQPFFQPSVDKVEAQALDMMRQIVSDAVAAYWEKSGGGAE